MKTLGHSCWSITYNRPKMEEVNSPSTNERISKMKTIQAKEYHSTLKGKEMLQHGRILRSLYSGKQSRHKKTVIHDSTPATQGVRRPENRK